MQNSEKPEDDFGYHQAPMDSGVEKVLGAVLVLGVLLVVLGITLITLCGAKAIEALAKFF